MEIQERDERVLSEIGKWRFLLGRQVKAFCGFHTLRTTDRRLKLLIENDYIERKKILYGIPSLYLLAHKGRKYLGLNKRPDTIRIEQIRHDIIVLDCVIYFLGAYGLTNEQITSEKQLHQKDGFGNRKHYPDFIFQKEDEVYAVEIELSLKSSDRLEKNIQLNYLNYDSQIWIVRKNSQKIKQSIESNLHKYPSIRILYLEEILNE